MDGKLVKELYRTMVTIRMFEERVSKLYQKGYIPGFVHLYLGEEAIATGVCANLEHEDYITSTHRGHGHLIAKGGRLDKMMAELFGKRDGYCGGKGGSMHIADIGIGILGANGIVGGGLPIAVGAGYGLKLLQKENVVVAFFGDGATNEGTFHEAMNVAAAFGLPVVFVCENNQFGVSTRFSRVSHAGLAQRGQSYGMETLHVDGMDVVAVYDAAAYAVKKAARGDGPTFLVADTWRYHGHFEGENVTYWESGELEEWKGKDSICRAERCLAENGVAAEEITSIRSDVEREIDAAVAFAEKSPYPDEKEAVEGLRWGDAK